ncbi:hypothetical protein [Pseudomonas putida]|uniref:Uncharacterized protein n=1 Tax=Pseudomonas putida TaxID=303 RepID=A0A8I1EED9_PSEPU|nr:hypothetical protein [Pseudomonas putida]MBI6885090.1 hypothetical protein [Pseudomonas putida]
MRLLFPKFMRKDAGPIFSAAGKYTRSISLVSSLLNKKTGKHVFKPNQSENEDLIYVYDMFFSPGSGGLDLHIDNHDDLKALEETFYTLVRTHAEVESGSHKYGKDLVIQNRGKNFFFSLPCSISSRICEKDERKSDSAPNDSGHRISCNHLIVHAIAGGQYIQVGSITFYCGIKDAIYLAHDLSVLRALINGADEDEVLMMRPAAHISDLTDDEIEELASSPGYSREDALAEYQEMKNEFYRVREKREALAPGEIERLEEAESKYFSSFPQKSDNNSFLQLV